MFSDVLAMMLDGGIAGVFIAVFALIVVVNLIRLMFVLFKHLRWLSIPTLYTYLADNPECETKRGVRCAQCGAGSIRNWGVSGANSSRRKFSCNHCGTVLYRN